MDADARLRAMAKKLHASMGSDNKGESDNARAKLVELLARNKKTWNDLPGLLTPDVEEPAGDMPDDNAWPADKPAPPALDLIQEMLIRHLHLTGHEFTALALWTAHTFFYNQFSHTPRLALISPVRGCGKSTVLKILKALCFKPQKLNHTTPASLFRMIDRDHPTVLLDEVDNADLPINSEMRIILNSGYEPGDPISRTIKGEPRIFDIFAPVALAAIGNALPLPLLDRSIVLHMERAPQVDLPRFDPRTNPGQAQQCKAVYDQMFAWARECNVTRKLSPNPKIPAELNNRKADKWRILIAIADAAGPAWGDAARVAAVPMCRGQDEDIAVILLSDIRDIYNRLGVDQLKSEALVAALLEAADGAWSEWRGPRGNQAPISSRRPQWPLCSRRSRSNRGRSGTAQNFTGVFSATSLKRHGPLIVMVGIPAHTHHNPAISSTCTRHVSVTRNRNVTSQVVEIIGLCEVCDILTKETPFIKRRCF
jgi:hypothetical protein